ncbi:DUF4249 domain-containing protein [Maribacter arenosus]|uniref:DUF4249 domain-containing protein n=1 Tax=Maribacter arenosus TaxID=1854708 RepID=A0ABR7VDF6_9FLAO|nr:DUF4249 domain-containing protein [Maribacter arenosus]MBD0851388.1 DUF4249 domain-containing protein [Maribacter arenosus]
MTKIATYRPCKLSSKIILFSFLLFLIGCVEPYEGEVADYEDVLVVNANLTNEFTRHEVRLTRSYRFEEDGPRAESNANVMIIGDDGSLFAFEETDPGTYLTLETFAAQPDIAYSLSIETENGNSYASDAMQLPSMTTIENLYAELTTNDDGEDGIGIFVDSYDPGSQSKFYRFEFEETYKIIVPFWSPFDAVVVSEGEDTFSLNVILREREEQVCYGTDSAKEILIQSTLGLAEDRITRFNVRFIKSDNYIISHRYSILVRQHVQNPESFAYYETLRGLSKSAENIFSEDQPGFLGGNISATDGSGENVAGFFEVSTVNQKRIFFDYEDFYLEEEKPPHKTACLFAAPTTSGRLGERELLNAIYEDRLRFYDYNRNPTPAIGSGPFLMVRPECGDCTVLGSNKVPDFWEE